VISKIAEVRFGLDFSPAVVRAVFVGCIRVW
jgi:hypothetical protein